MKKYLLGTALAVMTALPLFAAADPDPNEKVLEQFRKEFPSAESVKWATEAEFAKVSFIMAGRRVIAYFNLEEGLLEGSIRDIFYDQLPLAVMTALSKRFQSPVVLYIREINNSEGTSYKIRLDEGEKKFMAKVSADGVVLDVDKVK